MAQIYLRLKALYAKEGGAFPTRSSTSHWPYKDPDDPEPEELAKEMNGYGVETVTDPSDPTKVLLEKGKQVPSFAVLRDDGTTACGCWIYSGCFTETGNKMARRDNSRPRQYRRLSPSGPSPGRPTAASCTTAPRPTSTARRGIRAARSSNGTARNGRATTCRTSRPTAKPQEVGPFIMNAGGGRRACSPGA